MIPELGAIDRGFFPLVLGLPVYLQVLLWERYVLNRDDRDQLIRAALVTRDSHIVLGFVLGALLLMLTGLWLRRHQPQWLGFQFLAVQYYAVSMAFCGFEIGTQSFISGVVILSTPMVGLMLLDRKVVLLGFATGLVVVAGCGLGSALGYLPYAPALRPAGAAQGSLFGLLTTYYFSSVHVVLVIVMTDQLLIAWRQREAEVRLLSRTDVLTGLHNRRHILEILDAEVARSRRQQGPLAVIMMDLDHFKQINDSWGHQTGDAVLREVGALLLSVLRQQDAAGRYGGEEFLIVVPDTSQEGALRLTQRFREQLATTRMVTDSGVEFVVSCSMGVACYDPAQDLGPNRLIRQADAALYRAKANGRNRVELAL